MSNQEIPYGYCHCGCGQKTNIAKYDNKRVRKGEHFRFIYNHHNINKYGRLNKNWKGGRRIHDQKYVLVLMRGHHRSDVDGYVKEHTLIAERILGMDLPKGAVVHHVNGIKNDNRPQNLVVCQDTLYHHLLHRRERALIACGHAHWKKCCYCKKWDSPENMYIYPRANPYHRECRNKDIKEKRLFKKNI